MRLSFYTLLLLGNATRFVAIICELALWDTGKSTANGHWDITLDSLLMRFERDPMNSQAGRHASGLCPESFACTHTRLFPNLFFLSSYSLLTLLLAQTTHQVAQSTPLRSFADNSRTVPSCRNSNT